MVKVQKYGKEHTIGYKKNRKECEYESFAKEVQMRARDIKKNFVHSPRVAMNESNLVRKEKEVVNNCVYAAYGCKGTLAHKTNCSKHYLYYKLVGAALDTAKAKYLANSPGVAKNG